MAVGDIVKVRVLEVDCGKKEDITQYERDQLIFYYNYDIGLSDIISCKHINLIID